LQGELPGLLITGNTLSTAVVGAVLRVRLRAIERSVDQHGEYLHDVERRLARIEGKAGIDNGDGD
jgi:hypothetical protein